MKFPFFLDARADAVSTRIAIQSARRSIATPNIGGLYAPHLLLEIAVLEAAEAALRAAEDALERISDDYRRQIEAEKQARERNAA